MSRDWPRLRLTVPEALLSIGLVAWGVSEAVVLPSPNPVPVRVVFALLATMPLAWRNRAPGAVVAWTLAILCVQEIADVLSDKGVTPYQCVCLATYALAASERRGGLGGLVAIALVIAFPSFLYAMDTDGSYGLVHAVATALVQFTIVVAGTMVRQRRIEARREGERQREEARSAPGRLATAIEGERRTIAAELRALITADLSTMQRLLVQASAALGDRDSVRAARLAAEVQETAAQAVSEMRRLLLALGGSIEIDTPEAAATAAHAAARRDREQWLRDRAADVAVVTPLVVLTIVDLAKLDAHVAASAVSAALLLIAPAIVRRRWPIAVAAVLSGGMVVRELAGLLPALPITLMPTLIVAGYAAGAFAATSRRAAAGAGIIVVGGVTLALLQLDEGGAWPDVPVVLFVVGCAFAVGELVRNNDGRILTLRAGTARLAAEHRQRRAAARGDERRRAARELHDVVAHGVSLVAVQAGAAAAIVERDPAGAARAVELAREAAAQTRGDLGRLAEALGVGTQAPPPGATDLRTLVESARRSGQAVELQVDGPLDELPADAGVSLYRIVQETLTNARKHGPPGALTTVEVEVGAEGVTVAVRTDGAGRRANASPSSRPPGSGRGIAGMTERARLLGGELEAGPTAAGGFAVTARLPVTPAAS